ncbi:MHYT domain-containing protein [Streptomyces sulphureus]|uniref:MHYT domain-containing protein n=1 Tax=Streptomyces sulphureus TaxID=47758 RepID=UPI00035E13F2|nr:MHYT domain-containing protein [Streptomyces sulphureus]
MYTAAAVPVDGFSHGPLVPLAAYAMACLGSAVGLRCTARARTLKPSDRSGWLLLGSVAISAGVFAMHYVAMTGFSARGMEIGYDLVTTYMSLLVGVVVIGLGIFLVGRRDRGTAALLGGGIVTGIGVAGMHYLGMAGMRMPGTISYDGPTVALSLAIAIVAATVALWFATSVKFLGAPLGAALIMGIAVSGMHYTAIGAATVHAYDGAASEATSTVGTLALILVGPVLLLLFVGLFVTLDPTTERGAKRSAGSRPGGTAGGRLERTPFEHR